MIFYNIYQNISDENLLETEMLIKKISELMGPICYQLDFIKRGVEPHTLILEYYKNENGFYEAFGFKFDDLAGQNTFSFYVDKSTDRIDVRYSLSEYIAFSVSITAILSNCVNYLNEALNKINTWTFEDLIKNGDKTNLN